MAEPSALAVRVIRVTADHWRTYRDVRLASLIDSPRAFSATYAEAAELTEEQWRARLHAGLPTWIATEGVKPVGTVSLWRTPDQPADEGVLIGMWVASASRGTGVADALVAAALEHARGLGRRRILLDVARENHRAAGFYRRLGFRPTGASGAMPWDSSVIEETLALDLSS